MPCYLNFYQNSASHQPSKAENLPPPGGSLREAVSEEDGHHGNSHQENIFVTRQDTTATSQSDTTMQLAPRRTTLEENDDIIRIDGLVRNLKKVNHYIHHQLFDYLSLVFTKLVKSNFRAF